jgi:DNA-binding beta-propeller fold protein YncE
MKIGVSPRTTALVGALLSSAAIVSLAHIAQAQQGAYVGYRVTKETVLPGKNPRWDHVTMDEANRHVFIGRRDLGVTVVNADTGEISEIKDTKGTNGAYAAPDLGIGLSDNGTSADVTVFDLKTLAVKSKIKVPKETDGVWYDPATKTAYVNNGDEGSITLFDPVSGKVGDTIALNSKKPEFSAVDGKGRAFVDLQDKNQIAVVDLKTKKLANTWNVDCVQPTGMYYEPQTDRLFVPCRGTKPLLAVVDGTSGKTVYSFPIGLGVDAVTFNPTEKLILTSNGTTGTVSVFKQDSKDAYHLVETVATRLGARTMTLDPKTQKAFTVTAEYTQPAPANAGDRQPPPRWVSDTFRVIQLERMPIQ